VPGGGRSLKDIALVHVPEKPAVEPVSVEQLSQGAGRQDQPPLSAPITQGWPILKRTFAARHPCERQCL
jgi:hypothetical protein